MNHIVTFLSNYEQQNITTYYYEWQCEQHCEWQRSQFCVMNNIMNDIVNDKKGHNIVNDSF